MDIMLTAPAASTLTEIDHQVFHAIVPQDHYLRMVLSFIDFERFRPALSARYSATMGRPPIDPVRMLKIMYLRFHYKLSDRQVMVRSVTDMAFRWFLGLSMEEQLPDHTNGTHFRQRIGPEPFEQVFQELVTLARAHGLVNDRLRLKDATHIFAAAADVRPLQLAAQVRDLLLQAAEPFFAVWVSAQRVLIETLGQATAELADAERLSRRLEQLQNLARQLRELAASLPAAPAADGKRQRLNRALAVVAKLLADHADSEAGDRLVSGFDADARVGKHGDFYCGFLVDIAMDADSEIITSLNVLAANGAEAADAITLIEKEEAAQGNAVEGLSIDGAGYNGPVLRELTDPEGLNLDVTVPPPQVAERKTFGPERFSLKVLESGSGEVTCPNGQTTRQRERIDRDTGYKYIFKPRQCSSCPLRHECLQNPASKKGRTVIKNDYAAEYLKVHEKAKTPEYEQTRRQHSKVERKLGELARHHALRQAQFWGQQKVQSQALLTGLVVNVKRIVKLLVQKVRDAARTDAVRAALAPT